MFYDAHKSTSQLEFLCWNYERYDLDKEKTTNARPSFGQQQQKMGKKPFHWIIHYFES